MFGRITGSCVVFFKFHMSTLCKLLDIFRVMPYNSSMYIYLYTIILSFFLFTYSIPLDVGMNPICQTDIDNPECQLWMTRVYEYCKDLYARETSNAWDAWWHDETPPIYKEVADMTIYDCNKLKKLLEMEVAALQSKIPNVSMKVLIDFKSWQTILLIAVYIVIILIVVLILYMWRKERRGESHDDEEKVDENQNEKTDEKDEDKKKSSSTENVISESNPDKTTEHEQIKLKNWLRQKARPIFLHNEASLRRQQEKYKENERLREWYTMKNIEKWTKARRKIERKREKGKAAADPEKPK